MDDVKQCHCGSSWFRLVESATNQGHLVGAVSINEEGSIIAYSGLLECYECGDIFDVVSHPAEPTLRLVQ